MKKTKRTETRKALLTAALGAVAACGASAYEVPMSFFGTNMPPLDFHGFASQGFLYSSDYNYLATDTKNGSFKFSEFGVNVSMNPFPRTRIAVQGFDYDVGNVGQYAPILDYALLEYTFNDEVGIRAGRIRRPGGIYNHIQDVDLARTSVLLPQGIYDSRWRDFSGTVDGGELFGSIPLSKAGSLAYEIYAGVVNLSNNGGVARSIQNGLNFSPGASYVGIDQCPIYGGQLWWNTPLDCFRVGASGGFLSDFGYAINQALPSPPFPVPGAGIHTVGNIPFGVFSLEYLYKSWTFQAEYYTYNISGNRYSILLPHGSSPINSTQTEAWYANAAYRFNRWLEVGAYYTEYYADTEQTDNSLQFQKDAALSFRFDIKDWWLFKVEGHYIHGTGLLNDNVSNPVQNDNGWFMLAVKTTVSF
jgi:hypothetical protein